MSWWIYLKLDGKVVLVDRHTEGGTYQVGGNNDGDLNVTYNYGKHFRFPYLHEMKAEHSIKLLENAIKELGPPIRDSNYWKPTEGNVSHCLGILLKWAKQHSEAVWEVS